MEFFCMRDIYSLLPVYLYNYLIYLYQYVLMYIHLYFGLYYNTTLFILLLNCFSFGHWNLFQLALMSL